MPALHSAPVRHKNIKLPSCSWGILTGQCTQTCVWWKSNKISLGLRLCRIHLLKHQEQGLQTCVVPQDWQTSFACKSSKAWLPPTPVLLLHREFSRLWHLRTLPFMAPSPFVYSKPRGWSLYHWKKTQWIKIAVDIPCLLSKPAVRPPTPFSTQLLLSSLWTLPSTPGQLPSVYPWHLPSSGVHRGHSSPHFLRLGVLHAELGLPPHTFCV